MVVTNGINVNIYDFGTHTWADVPVNTPYDDATATLNIVGDTLIITLHNTSVANALESPGDTLSGLFFDIGALSLALTGVVNGKRDLQPGSL